MGQGGYVTIMNNTGSKMIQNHIETWQMESWAFPKSIEAGQSVVVYVEWCDNIFKCTSDDWGKAYYYLERKPEKKIEFDMWNANERNFTVKQIGFEGISSDAKRIPWSHDGVMLIEILDNGTNLDPKKWMSRIDDNIPLNKLSIPGTHDSLTYDLPYAVLPDTAKTQDIGIMPQLNLGCRYLDIRINSNLEGRHGFIDCRHGLWDVMKWVKEFLDLNKGETIVMRIKHDEGGNDDTFKNNINKLFATYKDLFWKNDLTNGWPLLKDVRGKVIVLDQLDGRFFSGQGYGYNYYDEGREKLTIQDDYDKPNEQTKFNEITALIESPYNPEKMKLNHTSAVGTAAGVLGFGWSPRDYANYENGRVVEYISRVCSQKDCNIGIIIFDFIWEMITKTVIFKNYKFLAKCNG